MDSEGMSKTPGNTPLLVNLKGMTMAGGAEKSRMSRAILYVQIRSPQIILGTKEKSRSLRRAVTTEERS